MRRSGGSLDERKTGPDHCYPVQAMVVEHLVITSFIMMQQLRPPPPFSNAPAKAVGVAAASVQKGLELMEDDEMDDEEYDIHTHRTSPSQTSLPPQDSPR